MSLQIHPDQPGWHDDPVGRFDSRYWDGQRWTRAVMRNGQVDTDSEDEPHVGDPAATGQQQPTAAAGGLGAGPLEGLGAGSSGAFGSVSRGGFASAPGRGPGSAPPSGWSATDRFTSLSPEEAQPRITQMLAISGIVLTDSAPGRLSATVTVAGEPNWILVVVLCLVWVVPGIVYWYVKSRPVVHPLTLHLLPAELGARIAVQGDAQALERVAPVLAQLPW